MLHYFLAAGMDEEDPGDLSLERMPNPVGPAEDGPIAIYTSKTKYTVLVLTPTSSITTIRGESVDAGAGVSTCEVAAKAGSRCHG